MAYRSHYIISLFALLAFTGASFAQPSIASVQTIGDQKVYRDIKKTNLYYYRPLSYALAADASGKPEFTFIKMRYTGTAATGDAGVARYNNLLQFRVTINAQEQKKITDLKAALKKMYPAADLRPLPIKKFSSVLVFASSGGGDVSDTAKLVKTSYAEATDAADPTNNSYWSERIVTLRLSNEDAQLVESALRNQQSLMSFSYAMYTIFSEADASDVQAGGNSPIRKEVTDFFRKEVQNQHDSALKITMIKADVVSLQVDPSKWPSAIQAVDINEKLPAKYPLFDVYCYDFNNEIRADLYVKKIEIKATSVNGADVLTSYTFRQSQPDLYAKSIRFVYAVRFDKPFYYRVTEINYDGDAVVGEWKQKKEWNEILDITSSPDKIVRKPVKTEEE